MTIHFHCGCGQKLKASDASVGKQFFCPLCGTKVTVPEADEAPVPAAAAAGSAPGAKAKQKAKAGDGVAEHDEAAHETNDRSAGDTHELTAAETHEFDPSEAIGFKARHAADEPDHPVAAESDTKVLNGGDTAVLRRLDDDTPHSDEKPTKAKPQSKQEPESKREPEPKRNGKAKSAAPRIPEPPPESLHDEFDEEMDADRKPEPAYRRNYAVVTDESDAPGATAADTARDLYKLVRQMKKDGKTEVETRKSADRERKKKSREDGESLDMGAMLGEMSRTVLPGIAGIALLCFLGYWAASSLMGGSRGWPELGGVTGVVKLDGSPLAGAMVTFSPIAEQGADLSHVSSSAGITDAQGRYELMYVADAPGAAVGKHQVMISSMLPNGKEQVPMKYNAGTTLAYEVKPGNQEANWDLQSPPKKK